jgi:hypothetical protein
MHAKKTVAGLGLRAVLGGYLEPKGWTVVGLFGCVFCVINLLFGVAFVVVPVVVCHYYEETCVRGSCRQLMYLLSWLLSPPEAGNVGRFRRHGTHLPRDHRRHRHFLQHQTRLF